MRSELGVRCQRVLAEAGRGAGSTRQQARAAARRFVRKHRRDHAHLEWVLRCAGTSAALAVALLGLGAEPAHAKATLFQPVTNPLAGQDIGSYSAPALGDLDADADLDLVTGNGNGAFRYFENTGTVTGASFVQRTLSGNPLAGQNVGLDSAPALADLDADGDLDVVAGDRYGRFTYFENTGSARDPAFARRTGSANPLDGADVGENSTPSIGDLDADGDLDLVTGSYDGAFRFFENTGNATQPAFVARTGAANPLDGAGVGYYAAAALADFDLDGDLDLAAGELYGSFLYYENTGGAAAPAFTLHSDSANPLAGLDAGVYAKPAAGDLDHDGDFDLLAGEGNGGFLPFGNFSGALLPQPGISLNTVSDPVATLGDLDDDGDLDVLVGIGVGGLEFYFENTGSATQPGIQFTSIPPVDLPGLYPAPALADLDDDGDLDLAVGAQDGLLQYLQNTGTPAAPAFVQRTGSANPWNGADLGSRSVPTFGDFDRDGDLDLVAGESGGGLFVFVNSGSASNPLFAAAVPFANVGTFSAPAAGDFDGDGDPDLVVGSDDGTFFYFENVLGVVTPLYEAANPLDGVDLGSRSTAAAGDLDGDGDIDLLVGREPAGFLTFIENLAVRPGPFYTRSDGPLAGLDVGSYSAPAAGDLDGDGDVDLVSGEMAGTFVTLRNTGSATNAAFAAQSGGTNPLAGQDVGDLSRPALGDLDADGDLDGIAGNVAGSFAYLRNTGSATSAAFAAQTGSSNPLDGVDVGDAAAPALGDLDADGDLDLIAANVDDSLFWYENVGDAEVPVFSQLTGAENPLDGLGVSAGFATPALGDIDRDGDLDLLLGLLPGYFYFVENTGNAGDPRFVLNFAYLSDQSVSLNAAPAFIDLDADGDLDLVSGERFGTFPTFYIPEPSPQSSWAAGASLLAWLSRWRSRKRR